MTALPAAAATPPAEEWAQVGAHDGWGVICDRSTPRNCRVAQSQLTEEAGSRRRMLLVMVWRENGKTGMSLTVPLGIDLRAGITVKVGEGAERQFPFLTCAPDGCRTIVLIDDQSEKDLRAGTLMRVGFRPLGNEKPVLINAPLKGLGAALDELGGR